MGPWSHASLRSAELRLAPMRTVASAAIAETERLRPQVVLLDIQLPDIDGFAVAERLRAVPEPPLVVLISSREAAAYGPRLPAAEARGFLTKRELSGQALAALVS